MSEQNVNSTPAVVTTEHAVEYITNELTNGELHMKTVCKILGWSFPRIRSRALTIAKKMNCTLTKTSRGVYILEPFASTAADTAVETSTDTAEVSSDALVDGDGTEDDNDHTLDPDDVEAALLGKAGHPSDNDHPSRI